MILFLDYDGVLHPDEAYLTKRGPVLRADGTLFMWAEALADVLAAHPHVQIVLSTSWTRQFGFNRARRYLPATLRERAIGATWHSAMIYSDDDCRRSDLDIWWDRAIRYQQIRRYVDRARLGDWIAVDDDAEGWADADRVRLVETDSALGLGDPAIVSRLRAALDGRS